MSRSLIISALSASSLVIASAAPAAPALERQLHMKSIADSAKIIGELFGEKRPYSQQEFRVAADNIRAYSGQRLVESFQGEPQADSKADAEAIASSMDEFARLATEMELYASALSSAADRNPSGLGPETRMGGTMLGSPFGRKADAARDATAVPPEHAYHLMLQTCTSCHARFRRP
ncbi:Putative cytochrome c-like protein [Neorhizobium galegae bv. orientalis]|nr:Putative cytochrome c-like protein [Neorhizobium galegae bv. orientalis]